MQCMVAQQREAEENSFNVCYFFIIGSWTMKSEREEKNRRVLLCNVPFAHGNCDANRVLVRHKKIHFRG